MPTLPEIYLIGLDYPPFCLTFLFEKKVIQTDSWMDGQPASEGIKMSSGWVRQKNFPQEWF